MRFNNVERTFFFFPLILFKFWSLFVQIILLSNAPLFYRRVKRNTFSALYDIIIFGRLKVIGKYFNHEPLKYLGRFSTVRLLRRFLWKALHASIFRIYYVCKFMRYKLIRFYGINSTLNVYLYTLFDHVKFMWS